MPLKVVLLGKNGGSRSRAKDPPTAWAASYTGPRQENQDYYGRADQETPHYDWQDRGCIYVLADGMGGLAAGAKAARMAVKEVIEQYSKGAKDAPVAQNLTEAIQKANRKIYAAGQGKGGRMGSTIVVCVLKDGSATIAHAGDSRAYVLSNGKLDRLTTDHLYAKEVLGIANDDDAKKNAEGHKITRALGKDPEIQIEPGEGGYGPEDRFLLCSDGFSEVLEEDEIKECLSEPTPEKAVHALISSAGSRLTDNATAVVAFASGRKLRRRQKVKKSFLVLALLFMAAALGAGGWWGWNHEGKGIFDELAGRTTKGGGEKSFTVSKTELTFDPQPIKTPSARQSVTVQNTGKSDLQIQTSIGANETEDFTVSSQCEDHPVPAGQQCSIDVSFTPIQAGSRTGQLNITGNNHTDSLHLRGTGTEEEKALASIENDTAKPIVFWKEGDLKHSRSLLPKRRDKLAYDTPLTGTERVCWRYKTDRANLQRACVLTASSVPITDKGTRPVAVVNETQHEITPVSPVQTVPVLNKTNHDFVALVSPGGKEREVAPGKSEELEIPANPKDICWKYKGFPNSESKCQPYAAKATAFTDDGDLIWNGLQTPAPKVTVAVMNKTNHDIVASVSPGGKEKEIAPAKSEKLEVPDNPQEISWRYKGFSSGTANRQPYAAKATTFTDDGDIIWSGLQTPAPKATVAVGNKTSRQDQTPAAQKVQVLNGTKHEITAWIREDGTKEKIPPGNGWLELPPNPKKVCWGYTEYSEDGPHCEPYQTPIVVKDQHGTEQDYYWKAMQEVTIRNKTNHEIIFWAQGDDEKKFTVPPGKSQPVLFSNWRSRPAKVCWSEQQNPQESPVVRKEPPCNLITKHGDQLEVKIK